MYRIYFKQALGMLKQNKFISAIAIIGTALAIMMILVIVMADQRCRILADDALCGLIAEEIAAGAILGKDGIAGGIEQGMDDLFLLGMGCFDAGGPIEQ